MKTAAAQAKKEGAAKLKKVKQELAAEKRKADGLVTENTAREATLNEKLQTALQQSTALEAMLTKSKKEVKVTMSRECWGNVTIDGAVGGDVDKRRIHGIPIVGGRTSCVRRRALANHLKPPEFPRRVCCVLWS